MSTIRTIDKPITFGLYLDITNAKDDYDRASAYYGDSIKDLTSDKFQEYLSRLADKVNRIVPKPVPFEITTQHWLDASTSSSSEEVYESLLGTDWKEQDPETSLYKVSLFNETMNTVLHSYPTIFSKSSSKSNTFSNTYGALHLIITVVEFTNTPLDDVLRWSIYKTLNLIAYRIEYNKLQEKLRNDNSRTNKGRG